MRIKYTLREAALEGDIPPEIVELMAKKMNEAMERDFLSLLNWPPPPPKARWAGIRWDVA